MKKSNYELMKEQMQLEFLNYDQEKMIEKFQLKHDKNYIYIRFVGRMYRLNRFTGKTEWSDDEFKTAYNADYNEAMTIFDVLCCSKENCHLSGHFDKTDNLKGVVQTGYSKERNHFYTESKKYFDHKNDQLAAACIKLSGIPEKIGDVAYKIPLFDFLPVIFQFWNSDEEFDASLQLLWDTNILSYMHYETTWFAASHMIRRLKELIQI